MVMSQHMIEKCGIFSLFTSDDVIRYRKGILGQIVIESMLLLVVGLLIGDVLAYATLMPLQGGIDISVVAEGMEMMGASSVLYPKLYLKDVVLANVVVLILGFFASLSPAWRASRYEPVEAITKVG